MLQGFRVLIYSPLKRYDPFWVETLTCQGLCLISVTLSGSICELLPTLRRVAEIRPIGSPLVLIDPERVTEAEFSKNKYVARRESPAAYRRFRFKA